MPAIAPQRPMSRPGGNLPSVIDYASLRHRYAIALLVFVSLLAMLPGFFQIPPVDRDEPRFAQATKQMLERGDYVDIRFQQSERYVKPIGIYWLQAAVVRTAEAVGVPRARTRIWLYRLPSLAGALAAVLLTYWSALAFVGRRAAITAGLMMACCVLLGIEARLAKTDAVLLATVTAAFGALARIYVRERETPDQPRDWVLPLIFWTALAVGTLIKGPLIWLFVALPAVTVSIADRSGRWLLALRPLPGLIWCALLVMPWFAAIAAQSGSRFFKDALAGDLVGTMLTGQDSRGRPPGYHFLLFWVMFWPGAALAAIVAMPLWRARAETGVRFLLAFVLPAWLLFEFIVTKQPHYVLPLFPAIAILIALAVEGGALSEQRWLRAGTAWWFFFPLIVFAGSITAIAYAGRPIGYLSWPLIAIGASFGLFAWWLYSRYEAENSLLKALAGALLIAIGVHGLVVPALSYLSPSPDIARLTRSVSCQDPQLASAGFHEPSLVFLTRTDTVLTDGQGAADFLREGGCRVAAVESGQLRNFLQYAERTGVRYDAIGRVERFNIARGRRATISVFGARAF